jgi:hypothetical protein
LDLIDRNDLGGKPMLHDGVGHSGRKLSADGLHYCLGSTTCIVFCAFDTYTYTFEAPQAGK